MCTVSVSSPDSSYYENFETMCLQERNHKSREPRSGSFTIWVNPPTADIKSWPQTADIKSVIRAKNLGLPYTHYLKLYI